MPRTGEQENRRTGEQENRRTGEIVPHINIIRWHYLQLKYTIHIQLRYL